MLLCATDILGNRRIKEIFMAYDIKKQHMKGKLHAIERINLLLDSGSFFEINSCKGYSCIELNNEDKDISYDGVITGFGTINGKKIAIYSQDFTVQGGSLGNLHGKKIAEIYSYAITERCPIIGINDSGGARIQEGITALARYGEIFTKNVEASGYIPQISIIAGPCAGGAAYSTGITDFIFTIDNISKLFITGSKIVKAAINVDISDEELGGTEMHSRKSGVVHFRSNNEIECFYQVKRILNIIPHYYGEIEINQKIHFSKNKINKINTIIPIESKKSYDVKQIINCLVDDDTFIEIQLEFAQNIVIGFALINGKRIGLIANQSYYLGGVLNCDSADKAARFVRYCDSFDIPLLTLVDVPGFIPGPDEEQKGIIRHGAKLIYAYSEATVPKITVILRKAYGGAYIAMCSRNLGADFVFAWENAEIAVMGADEAYEILNKNVNSDKTEAMNEYCKMYMNSKMAISSGYITEVIKPESTRKLLEKSFSFLETKNKESLLKKKHGNIPL